MATGTMRATRSAPISVYLYYVGLGCILTTAATLANPRAVSTWIAEALLPTVELLGSSPSPRVAAGIPPESARQPEELAVPAGVSSSPTRLPVPKPVEIASAAALGSNGSWPKIRGDFRSFSPDAVTTVQAEFQQGVFPSGSYASAADTFINAMDATVQASAQTLTVDLSPGPQAALIKFGGLFTSEGGPIPIGSTINSAILQVNVPTSPSNAISGATISFYALRHAWADTNTHSTFGSSPWNSTAGIQVGNTAETEAAPDAARTFTATGAQTVDVTSRVQAWSNDPSSNFGWVLDEGTALDDGFIFESSEALTTANRPKLTVTYTAPGACLSNSDCPDGNPCTDDLCDLGTGTCSHPNNDANACNDADLCTIGDFCSAGDCTGTPVSCSGGLNCNPSNGQCESGEILIRQPYLQQATPTSMTIVWRSATAGDSRVRYGTTQGVLNQTATNPTVAADHIVTITGLAPATRYYYDVGTTTTAQGGGTANHFFKTSPPANDTAPFRVWALGDSGQGNATQLEVRDAMLAYTAANPPDLMIHMGDIAYSSGTDSEFTNKHFAVYQDTLRHTPSWPTLGNHEGASTTSGSPGSSTGPYYSAFVLPTNGEAGGVASGTEAYYSFDRGNTHFIVLNSFQVSRSASGPMAVWLQSDLATTDKQWVIAFWHHPPYTKGTHNSDTETELIDMRQNLLPILEAGGVDLVITGHSHTYERSYLIDGTYTTPTPGFSTLQSQGHIIDSGNGKLTGTGAYHKNNGQTSHDGAVYVVAGHGGATPDGGGGSLNHPVMYFSEADRGSCILDISQTALTLTNVRSTGVVSDNFTIEKGVFTSPTSVTFQQGVSGYTGTQDTYVHQNFPSTVEGSVVSWKWDTEDPAGFAAFGLIRFDNIFGSGAGQIPVGSTITSATLTLVGFNATATPAATINEVAVDWQAATATWNDFGGDAGVQSDEYRATPSYAAPLLTGATASVFITASIDVAASIQSWSNDPALNFGWVFRPSSTDGAEVFSAEQTTANQRPILSVTFTPPPTSCTFDADCNDNNPCNGTEICVATVCQAGAALSCDDSNACTTDTCNTSTGCVHTDNSASCTDGNACTTDSCNTSTGCVHTPTSCPSGQSCNPTNGQCQAAQSLPIAIGDTWKYLKGTAEPPAAWATTAFDDTSWLSGPSGIGYADGDDATVLSDMQGATQPPGYVAVYVRKAFSVPNPANVSGLDLIIDYDDGFVAYLNGTEVARRNMTAVAYNSVATASHEASAGASGNPPETISLNAYLGSLVTGTNVLAIHGANQDVNSSDLSLIPRLVATAPANPPPTAPSLPDSPANGAAGVSTSPQLCVTPTDANGDPLTVTFKGRQGGGGSGTPFTVIAMPDTQFYSESFPTTYESQTMWVRDNRVARNIVMSVGLGDCVNVAGTQAQWDNANAANSILENPATTGLLDGIPYGIAVGNHDQNPINQARSGVDENVTTLLYNQTFPKSRFQGRGYFGGQYGLPGKADSMDNHYELFNASGMDFIVFHLEWDDGNCTWPSNGSVPTGTLTTCQNVMVWMRDLLVNTYPNRRAIIASHYVGSPGSGGAGTMTLSNQGQAYLNLAKPLPNVFLMLGGHLDQSNHRFDLANDGHPIYTVVSDYQTRPNGGNGWLRIMTFDPAADTIHIETYSPTLLRFINKPTPHADDQSSEPNGNELTLAYDMDAGLPFQTIGANSGVASGSQTCVTWPGLTTNQLYEWKVDVSDGTSTATSPMWSFTTLSCTVNGDCNDSNPCTTDTCQAGVCNHAAVPLCCTTAAQCDDSNVCTTDSCNAGNTCDHVNNSASCSDGNACTTVDACSGGACVGGVAANCNDGNACTTDSCVPATGCAHAYAPTAGCCASSADCNDANVATTDTCTLPAGDCSNVANTTCTTSAECNDGDACTTDVCNGSNGAALSFDGTDDYVTFGTAAGLGSAQFTIETWFKKTGNGVSNTTGTNGIAALVPLVAKGAPEADGSNLDANYILGINTAGNVLGADFEDTATGGNHPVSGTTAIVNGTWYHAAATYDGTTWRLYLNGNLEATIVVGAFTPRSDSIQHAGLGAMLTSTGSRLGAFQGLIDEPRIWNVARTQAQIQASMNQQLTSGTGLAGRWGLNEAAGITAGDSTVPTENGTLTNGPSWSTSDKPSIGDGTCSHAPVASCCSTAAQCDDGNPCTEDSCSANVCQHAAIAGCCLTGADCNDGNACTDDSCNGSNVCVHANNTAPCNDGDICTTGDACGGGSCQPGAPNPNCCQADATCNDGNACTTDSCDTTNDAALSIPTAAIANRVNFDAGTGSNASPDYINFFGTSSFTIEGWIYTPGGAAASTGVFRHGRQGDFAQVVVQLGGTGNLQLLGSVESNATGADQVDVTSPTVLTANTWNHFALVVDRSGGQQLRLIVNGGTPAVASGAVWSTSAISSTDQTMLGVARDTAGALILPFSGRLDEVRIWNIARTQAQIAADMNREIESATGLVHRWSFNAGTGTTAVDAVGGINGTLTGAATWSTTNLAFAGSDNCVHANVTNGTTCTDGDACTSGDVCTTGVCAGTAINCDDGNSCTADSCSGGVCSHVALGDGTVCSDGNLCTTGDACAGGACVGTAINCDDGNACTTDSCTAGTCGHVNVTNGTTCSDGNLCTTTDICTNGTCAGTAINCDDGNSCTADSCTAGTCGHGNLANGTTCSDGTACTTGDVCASGVCVGTALNCDDGNVCTNDSCNPGTGCVHANNNATCATDGNPCTDDVCSAGSCTHPNNDANACTDGNACTGDACVGGTCQSWYAPSPSCCSSNANCNDGVGSTTDTCVGPPNGTCSNVVAGGCTTAAQCNDSNGCTTDACVGAVGGSALNFDGVDDNVTMGTALGLDSATFTLEGWIKKDGASWGTANASTGGGGFSNVVALITKGRSEGDTTNIDCNYFLGITAGGRLVADFEQFAASSSPTLPAGQNRPICATAASAITDNNWHHVAVTYDKAAGKGWRLYKDGVEVTAADGTPATCGAESTCAAAANCPQNPLVDPRFDSIQHFALGMALNSTGAFQAGSDGFFGGEMDEVRVWNRALTQTEIQTGMNQELTSGTGLLGRWGLNENTGTTAGDSATSPTTENGTLRNNTVTPANGPVWTADSPIPAVPGSCTNTSIPGCSPCGANYQCSDSNACTADSCNTSNDAAIVFPSRGTATDHIDFAAGGGSNASPDYINFFGTSSFTIESWVYTDGTSATNASIFRVGRSGDFPLIGLQITGLQLTVSIEASAVGNDQVDLIAPAAFVANTWTHVAVVVDRSTNQMRIHLNGGAPATAAAAIWATSPIGSSDTSILGVARATDGSLNLPYVGRVDELRIWNFARTQAQIAGTMGTELESATGLVHRWSFNVGSGTTALDSVGGVTGTLTGVTTWATTPLPFAGADSCVHTNVTNGSSCSDGNACTVSDSCQSGACASGSPAVSGTACGSSSDTACDNPDTCNGSGACQTNIETNGTSCDDGNPNTTGDQCSGGVCAGSPDLCVGVTCTAQDQCHVAGTCNPATGLCSNPTAPNGTTCSDGDACTLTDTCQSGFCTGSSTVTCTASDQCHVAGTCNPATGLCSNPTAPNGTTCSDGDACTLTDTCQSGFCTGSSTVTCTASDQCHVAGTCNPATGLCSNPTAPNGTTCSDGDACTLTDTCQSGFCTGSSTVTCTASDQCHVAGTCNPATGLCSNPTAPNGTSCSDGDACSQTDTCQSGVCTGSNPVTCTASDQCHVAGTCNPATGICTNPTAANGTTCSDGDACTQTDTCQSGLCTGSNPATCTAQDQCHVAGTCNPATGACSNPTAANGTTCTDGDACSQTDTCQSGVCTGSNPVTCTASDQCHVAGTCNPATGACSNPTAANGTTCSDGDACSQTDTCQSGVCTGSNPVTCTASDQCHVAGTCSPATGLCSNPTAPNGTTCTDGNLCTQTDTCQSGVCSGSNPVACNNGDQCNNAGTCNPGTGSCSGATPKSDGTTCSDGSLCTTSDTCGSGICNGGPAPNCDDSSVCTIDTCAPATGCVHTSIDCSDGDSCTNDTCVNPSGCQHTITCVDDASDTAPPGGTVSSDPENDGATPSDQIETAVTSPSGGAITIQERPATEPLPAGYDVVNLQIAITAPPATVGNPLTLVFRIDASALVSGYVLGDLTVFRDGVLVANCSGAPGEASPDPCVASRTVLGDGDVGITVLTSHASVWNLAVPNCDDGNDCTDDSGAYPGCAHAPITGGGTITCGVGACQNTVSACVAGVANTCTPGSPTAEACDGLDNDCNGNVDETPLTLCNDSNLCTADSCGGFAGCAHTPVSCDDGNTCTADSCSPGSGCSYAASGACSTTGNVYYYRNSADGGSEPSVKPVPSVGIDGTSDAIADSTTDGTGAYALGSQFGNVAVTTLAKYGSPRASDHNGAISSLDASTVARAVVSLITVSPNQFLAGDVTGNGALSSFDASEIARFAVGAVNHFSATVASGSDWKFLRCNAYAYPGDPGCGAPIYNFTPINQGETGKNFYAVLLGDVTGNWQPSTGFTASATAGAGKGDSALEEQTAIVADQRFAARLAQQAPIQIVRPVADLPAHLSLSRMAAPLRAGERRELSIDLLNADGILGLDLGLTYDPSRIRIVGVETAGIGAGLSLAQSDRGGVHKIAAYGVVPLSGSGTALIVTVEALKNTGNQAPLQLSGSANEGGIPLEIRQQRIQAPAIGR